jgi:Glycogen recognition site of AMP-activated protein kinase
MTDITPTTSRTGLGGRSRRGAAGDGAAAVPRAIIKLQYKAARLPFSFLDEYVIGRYWGQNTPVRVGFERWLGLLDLLAGRLLADEEISWRGEALMRQTTDLAQTGGHVMDVPVSPACSGQVPAGFPAGDQAPRLRDQTTADQEQDYWQRGHQAVDELVVTGNAPPTANQPQTGDAAGAAGRPGTPDAPAAGTGTVDVTFTFPAEVPAGTVALCGEFNDWSAEDTQLKRGSDGSWQATLALEPGRSYRYRYLLDGQRWEDDRQADRYVPNALGSTDSVVVVE